MSSFVQEIHRKAKSLKRHVVLPEGNDERMLRAGAQMVKERLCEVTLLGNYDELNKNANHSDISLEGIRIEDPNSSDRFDEYIKELLIIRKHKQLTRSQAEEMMRSPLYYGAMMVHCGDADGSVAGAANTTGDVLRAAIHCIGLKTGISVVSSIFLMIVPGWPQMLTYADAGVVPDPNPEQLASIAVTSAGTHRLLTGNEPVVAFLSFSTYGSSSHKRVDKVKEAVAIARKMAPEVILDGEMQADAALVKAIGEKKASGSPVAGRANVLIFPDLDSGNIAYKLTQRLAKATALGPLIQGLKKPAMDLSRGCNVQDIVDVSSICLMLASV
ncbi:phosphate acetyltransferase [bacterium]|nr:phosphate acetyltransferase [bacterium]